MIRLSQPRTYGTIKPLHASHGKPVRCEPYSEAKGHPAMRKFVIQLKSGARITSVGANSVDEARERAREVLDRPGRHYVLRQWQADGEPVGDDAGQIHILRG